MLDQAAFESLISEIEGQGIDSETAGRFAVLIGDTPCLDKHCRVVVIDEAGQELARLDLPSFRD